MPTRRLSTVLVGGTTLPVRCAEILIEAGHSVRAIATDDEDVRRWADQQAIPRVDEASDLLQVLDGEVVDYLFSVNNLSVVPGAVLAAARHGGVNFHDGPLPGYAGLNAPTWGILNGETQWAVTWHVMTGGLDEGPVLLERSVHVDATDTSLTLNTRCFEAAIATFDEVVRGLVDGSVRPRHQDLSQRVYRGRNDLPPGACVIRWSDPAVAIDALVRALDFGGYPNPMGLPKIFVSEGVVAVVASVQVTESVSRQAPGAVVSMDEKSLTVATGTTDIVLTGFRTQAGSDLSPRQLAERVGRVSAPRFVDQAAAVRDRLGELHRELAPHEPFWDARLSRLSPLRLTQVGPSNTRAESLPRRALAVEMPDPVVSRLRKLVPAAAPADLLLAAATAYLSRVSGQDRFHVAYLAPVVEVDDPVAGALVSPAVPLELAFDTDRPFAAALHAVLGELDEVRAHRGFMRDLVGRTHGSATLESHPVALATSPDPAALDALAAHLVVAVDASADRSELSFDPAWLDTQVAERMRSQLAAFIAAASDDASTPLGDLSLLTDDDLRQLLVEWNRTELEYPRELCLHELIERQSALTPDRIALACRDRTMTFAELDAETNRLARRLRQAGVMPGRRVGVYLSRSIEMVVALLAILKAGGAYVPLDPAYPAKRIAFMIEDSDPVLVVTEQAVADRLPADIEDLVLLLDAARDDIGGESGQPLDDVAGADDVAYVIYTSGSTGSPKGVMISHRNLVNFVHAMDACIEHDAGGTWLAVTSISFDISVLELFWTLARGFTVVIYTGDDREALPQRRPGRPLDFSLFFFASEDREGAADRYRLLLESAKYADTHGFAAVWTPERHFHAFGGLFPNPSVTSAALATVTSSVQIRAGSVVSPLHDAIRIAEEWAFVDNLSHGRVGISFAAGWQPDDFVFAPERFADRKQAMVRQIEIVHRLWRGEPVSRIGPHGREVDVKILPRPVQDELPTWITAAGSPETFVLAGELGFGLLTHLLGQTVEELGAKIATYRDARARAGHHRDGGHVTVMLHTFVGPVEEAVREQIRESLKAYLRSSVGLIERAAWSFPTFRRAPQREGGFSLDDLTEEELDGVLEFSFERYYETSGLLGTPDKCVALVEQLRAVGVDEIACLIDFHDDTDAVLAHLPYLDEVRAAAASPALEPDAYSIPALVGRYGVTHMQCTPSLATMLCGEPDGRAALAPLRQLLVGGEALTPALASMLAQTVAGVVVNMYGPTETTIWSSTYRLDGVGEGAVPIGRPIANTRLFVLDDARHPVPAGTPGELYIGGDGVAAGYLNRPELTDERFVADPFGPAVDARLYRTGDLVRYRPDGNLEFLGRVDQQVKVRGYRIEIAEVEAVLTAHPDVEEAVVMAVGDPGDTDRRLVAYVTTRHGTPPTAESMRRHLADALPDFMVPAGIDVVPSLPRTPNGKVDRAALPGSGSSAAAREGSHAAPRDDLERRLVEIWERELGVRPIGVDENFFELGGHSLLALRVFAEIDRTFGVRLPLATFFRAPTVADLAAILRQEVSARKDSWSALVAVQPSGSRAPLFCVHAHGGHVLFYKDLARHLGSDQPFYALQARGVDGIREPAGSFEEMAAEYIEEIRGVQPTGPYRLGGDCLGGVVAYEMAQQLRALGEEVALVAMFDSFHPGYRPYLPASLYELIHRVRLLFGFHLQNVIRLPMREKLAYIRAKRQRLLFLGRAMLSPGTHLADPLVRTQHALDAAFDAYRPKPYAGRVVLYRASRQPTGIHKDRTLGWSNLIEQLDVRSLPVYFTTGVYEPGVQKLAADLRRRLAEVDADREPDRARASSTSGRGQMIRA